MTPAAGLVFDAGPVRDLLAAMPYQNKVGIRVEAVVSDGIDLLLPFDPQNLAVPDVLSAGVAFILGETAGGAILWGLFPPADFALVARRVDIRYLRPSCGALRVRPRVADLRWETTLEALRAGGRGRVTVPLTVLGEDERPVARIEAQYTLWRRAVAEGPRSPAAG